VERGTWKGEGRREKGEGRREKGESGKMMMIDDL
jgi:hypothetical protein